MSETRTEQRTIAERVKKIIIENLNVDEAKYRDESSFTEDFGADSLDKVELIMSFEEEFGCEISDTQAENITTVKDVIEYLEKVAP